MHNFGRSNRASLLFFLDRMTYDKFHIKNTFFKYVFVVEILHCKSETIMNKKNMFLCHFV